MLTGEGSQVVGEFGQEVGVRLDVVANTSALDPRCGAGVFLIAAARFLATAYAGVLYGTHQPAPLTRLSAYT